jgi:hypothetical protein
MFAGGRYVMGRSPRHHAVLLLVSVSAAPGSLEAQQTRRGPSVQKFQASICCTTADLFYCRDFQLCHPFPTRPVSAKRGERLQDRATLAFGPSLLPPHDRVVTVWTPSGAKPASSHSPAATSVPAQGIVTTRAGHIRDNEAEPEFPIITQGTTSWTVGPDAGQGPSVRATVKIDAEKLHLDLIFRSTPSSGLLVIEVSSVFSSGRQLVLAEMPRARRAGSSEGEPLLGRIAPGGDGSSRVELSSDHIDLTNNKRRLLTTPWLDFRLSDKSDKSSIITIEKGKTATDMMSRLLEGLNRN